SNVPIQSKICRALRETKGNFWQRTEKRLHPGKIKNHGVSASIFHTGRERLRTIQKSGMRCRLLQKRARTQPQLRTKLRLGFRHTRGDTYAAGALIHGKDFFQWRLAFENNHCL